MREGVVVIWRWEVLYTTTSTSELQANSLEESSCNTDLSLSDHDISTTQDGFDTVRFKYIETNMLPSYQKILQQVRDKLSHGEKIDVQISHEPDNPYDSQAIAFLCLVNNEWHRVGYVVCEALPSVHCALSLDLITDIQFAWVKYITKWISSGPGFYAAVAITQKGKWEPIVYRYASK